MNTLTPHAHTTTLKEDVKGVLSTEKRLKDFFNVLGIEIWVHATP
jgi:hypothetical protein